MIFLFIKLLLRCSRFSDNLSKFNRIVSEHKMNLSGAHGVPSDMHTTMNSC